MGDSLAQGQWNIEEMQDSSDLKELNTKNKQVRRFASLSTADHPEIVDALQAPWQFKLAYAFPPIMLLPMGHRKRYGVMKGTLSHGIRDAIYLAYSMKGYVCERKELLANGCCNLMANSRQYNCESCLPNGCCSVYEYCVSCCLQPNKQHILERFLKRAAVGFQNLFMAVEDHFELCLAKCRTSSQQHYIWHSIIRSTYGAIIKGAFWEKRRVSLSKKIVGYSRDQLLGKHHQTRDSSLRRIICIFQVPSGKSEESP
ncbi:unnamed protein product [Ranitomeya imitator]|uniref:SREBP regulating gene protein n=1 Tax=Ranitomeya imitator TaxID=111125 RepID=A0ABN9LLN7_9NEOB|nr:unnamed protein product [Ranitomeya imitator]